MKCTYCQSELSVGTRVCRACGHPVSVNPTLEDLYFSRLAAIAPSGYVHKVRSTPYLAQERRTITAIMFTIANVATFEKNIPEEDRNTILNQSLDRFAKRIFEYEGTIAKLWENTVLAFFGAPVTHEDDPLRALHAAASILDEVKIVSTEIGKRFKVPLQLKMVLNTGPILIGKIKSNLRFDFQSLNRTLECLDLALQAAIPYCELILFEDTYRFIKSFVECTKMDEIYCGGVDEVLHLWQVDQIINQGNSLQEIPVTHNTALIGRKKELDQLLELSETVLAGLGRVGLILGEPGIGKSRLILDWKRKMKTLHQPTQARWVEAQGLSFGRELAYHLLKNLLRASLNISEATPISQMKEVIRTTLQNLPGINEDDHYLFLAHLLEVPLADQQEERIHRLSSHELRMRYLRTVRTFFQCIAAEQPLIILLEDLHWADASSVDLINDLLSLTSSSPILFCLVSRKDRDSIGWELVTSAREKFGSRLTEIELDNLTEADSQTLIKQLIAIEEIPEVIREVVLIKSEGNPYFIEELVRMLINEGVLLRKGDRWIVTPDIDPNKIPDNLQGLLTARIDRLPPEARMALRIASVIGRSFPERVIAHVIEHHAPNLELMDQLGTLESIGMIKVAQVKPEITYKFQHILLQDAAYHSIVESDRSDLHLSVGNALEKFYPDEKERLASQLAHHYLRGNKPKKAFEFLDLAGHVSMEAFATAEAEMYFKQALQLTNETDHLAHLYTDLGEALAQQGKHREAVQAWKKAIQYHKKNENWDRLSRVYAWSARSAWWGYDPKRSLEICLEGLKAVEGAVESPDIAYLIQETGRAYLFNNKSDQARAYSEQALEMAKRLDAFDVQAEALATIGILPTIKPDQAIAALEMAVKISESNNLYGPASRAYINLAAVIDNLGEVRLARDYRLRAIKLGNMAGGVSDEYMVQQAIVNASLWLAEFDHAETQIKQMRQSSRQNDAFLDDNTLNQLFLEGKFSRLKGRFSQAIDVFTDLIDRSRQTNDQDRLLQANQTLAEVIIEPHFLEEEKESRTDIDIALSMLRDAMRTPDNTHHRLEAATYCLLSNIHALKQNVDEAEKALESANKIYRDHPNMEDRVRILLAKARLEIAKNNTKKALAYYDDSISLLEKMEGRWWIARIWLELGVLHLKRNEPENIDQAHNYFRESLAEFKDMDVDHYPDLIIDKLRQVKKVSRVQAIAHNQVNKELAEAGRVQHTFIPTHSPEIKGYDISGVLLPARETSGDFYDFIPLENGKLGVVIADVADKGAGAALYMAMSRTLIRTYAVEGKLDPEEVVYQVNRRILSDTQRGIFLTVVFGVLDPTRGTYTYINAGHNPPFLLSKSGEGFSITPLEKTGTLVGIFSENTWQARTIKINPGEVLLLYTDGITEAQNESNAFYGNDRLTHALENGFTTSAEDYRNAILKSVQAFTGTSPRLDDITLIVITRKTGET